MHQNRVVQEASSKRNSFSANWDAGSSLTQETQDDAIWAKDTGEFCVLKTASAFGFIGLL